MAQFVGKNPTIIGTIIIATVWGKWYWLDRSKWSVAFDTFKEAMNAANVQCSIK